MYSLDLWLLSKLRKFIELINYFLELFAPIFKIFFIMGLGAGLLLIYAHKQKNNLAKENSKSLNEFLALDHNSNQDRMNPKNYPGPKTEKILNYENFKNQDKNNYENLADFASEIVGGVILDTPNTHSYYKPIPNQATIFGIPIWKPYYYTPRKIIQPWTETGECWAFSGSHGKIEIELAHKIMIDKVTLEHIPKSLSLNGNINSAPRFFNVLGKIENHYVMIDTFKYEEDGPPAQIFHITKPEAKKVPFKVIMLEILSNYGNLDYTCIYRFKVHGKMSNTSKYSNNMRVH